MNNIQIRVEGLNALVTKLDDSGRILGKHLRRGMDRAIKTLQRKMQRYPAPPSAGHWAKTTTKKQKAAFFAQLKAGGWSKRTGTLGRRWEAEVKAMGPNVTGILSNPTSYAPHVVGDETQAKMHQGRWPVVGGTAEGMIGEIQGFFDAAIEDAVEELAR